MDSNNKKFTTGDTVRVEGWSDYFTFSEYTTDNEQCVIHHPEKGWFTFKAEYVHAV